jgi:hypothetical protein
VFVSGSGNDFERTWGGSFALLVLDIYSRWHFSGRDFLFLSVSDLPDALAISRRSTVRR